MSNSTQRDRVLELLRASGGAWVPAPELARIALQYGTRILELRRLGHRIENRTEMVNGSRHSWFRLVTPQPDREQQARAWIAQARSDAETPGDSLSLFPDNGPLQRHRDDG